MDTYVHIWHILAMKVEWPTVAQELVKALRGRATQGALSRRLGFKTNVVYRWEAGLREATADDLLTLLRLRVEQVEGKLWTFAQGSDGINVTTSEFSWADWLRTLRGEQPVTEIAEELNISPQAVRRIFRGDTDPPLSRLLQMIECLSNRILGFIELMTDPAQLKSLKGVRALEEAQLAITFEHLHAESIIACLETEAYAALPTHSNAWLAGRLDLPLQSVETTIEALVAARGIRIQGGKFKTQHRRMVNTQARSKTESRRLARHWTQVIMDRPEETTRSAYVVFSCDQETVDDIGRIMTEALYQVIARVAKTKTVDRVSAITVNMTRLDHAPEDEERM